jgi:hypothetical protein
MRAPIKGGRGFAAKLVLLCLAALSLLPCGCSQGGIVEGEVTYKMVNGMQDRRWFIIVRNVPAEGQPSIVFDSTVEDGIRQCFPAAGDLVVDDPSLQRIDASYDQISYTVTLHLMSGEEYEYYQACRAERDIFNQLQVGDRVRVDTEPSDVGPLITAIVA